MISVQPAPNGTFLVGDGWIKRGYYGPAKRDQEHDQGNGSCKICDANIPVGTRIYRHVQDSKEVVCATHFDQVAENLKDIT